LLGLGLKKDFSPPVRWRSLESTEPTEIISGRSNASDPFSVIFVLSSEPGERVVGKFLTGYFPQFGLQTELRKKELEDLVLRAAAA
jgi:hypothetical protein